MPDYREAFATSCMLIAQKRTYQSVALDRQTRADIRKGFEAGCAERSSQYSLAGTPALKA